MFTWDPDTETNPLPKKEKKMRNDHDVRANAYSAESRALLAIMLVLFGIAAIAVIAFVANIVMTAVDALGGAL